MASYREPGALKPREGGDVGDAPVFLISHRGALGDFALTWPLLQRLRARYPGHRFLGIGRPGHHELAVALGLLDAGLDAESAALLPFYTGAALPSALAGADAALVWTRSDAALEALLRTLPGPARAYPPFPEDGRTHVLDHHLAALSSFEGAGRDAIVPHAESTLSLSPAIAAVPNLVLLHPGSGSPAKNFSREFYLRLAAELPALVADRLGPDARVEIVLGPVEREEAVFHGGRFPVVEPSSALELARKLASAALYIGNDSGPAHVSALLGTPTLALFKATDPAVWGVRGAAAKSLFAIDEKQMRTRLREALDSLRFGTK